MRASEPGGTPPGPEASPLVRIARAAPPLVIGGSAATLMAFTDGLYLSRWSEAGFNALILAVPMVGLVSAIGSGVAAAVGEGLARSGEPEAASRETRAALLLTAAVAVAVAVLGAMAWPLVRAAYGLPEAPGPALGPALVAQGPDPALLEVSRELGHYWRWVVPSFPLQVILAVVLQAFATAGLHRRGAAAALLATGLNLAVNPLLIFGLGLGTVGAALATTASFGAALAWALWASRGSAPALSALSGGAPRASRASRASRAPWAPKAPRPAIPWGTLGRQAGNAAAVFAAIAVYAVGGILLAGLAARHGAATVTALGIGEQLKALFTLPTRGVCGAYLAVFGLDLAARRAQRYRADYWSGTALVAALHLPGVIAFLAFPGAVVGLYGLEAGDPAHGAAVWFVALSGAVLVADTLPRLAQVGFLSLGHTYGLVLQSLAVVGASVALGAWGLERAGARGLATGQAVGIALASGVAALCFFVLLHRRTRSDRAAGAAPPEPLPEP